MTATTDLTAQIADLYRVLADAAVECPDCNGKKQIPAHAYIGGATGKVDCRTCQGRGRVACFQGFGQECPCTDSEFEDIPVGQVCKCEVASNHDGSIGETNQRGACFSCRLAGYHDSTCPHVLQLDERCSGTGWQVHAGGLEDALAGLNRFDTEAVLTSLAEYAFGTHKDGVSWSIRQLEPMPSAPEILLKGLGLVCEIAELEVPDAVVYSS